MVTWKPIPNRKFIEESGLVFFVSWVYWFRKPLTSNALPHTFVDYPYYGRPESAIKKTCQARENIFLVLF